MARIHRSRVRIGRHTRRLGFGSQQKSSPGVDPSIVSIFGPARSINSEKLLPPLDFSWYPAWLSLQLKNLPNPVLEILEVDSEPTTFPPQSLFHVIFLATAAYTHEASQSTSIDEIISHLKGLKLLSDATPTLDLTPVHRLLIFAILGWQSMLYMPSFNTCQFSELAIHLPSCDVEYVGLEHRVLSVKQDQTVARRKMNQFLNGYGCFLPPGRRSQSASSQLASSPEKPHSSNDILPSDLNSHLLRSLLQIELKWVDTMSLHLEYDANTKTLSLFRYPSLCIAALQSQSVLHSFAKPPTSGQYWATCAEIDEFPREILLSYRLLFGQSKQSRKLLRQLSKTDPDLASNLDPFLLIVGAKRHFAHPLASSDRLSYKMTRDFAMFGGQIETLAELLHNCRPRGWKELWRDRRNSVQFWTFWLVALVGGLGLILSFAQVLLAAVTLIKT